MSSHFKKFIVPRIFIERFKFQLRAERLNYVCDFSRCLTSTRNIGKFNIMKISWLQND